MHVPLVAKFLSGYSVLSSLFFQEHGVSSLDFQERSAHRVKFRHSFWFNAMRVIRGIEEKEKHAEVICKKSSATEKGMLSNGFATPPGAEATSQELYPCHRISSHSCK